MDQFMPVVLNERMGCADCDQQCHYDSVSQKFVCAREEQMRKDIVERFAEKVKKIKPLNG